MLKAALSGLSLSTVNTAKAEVSSTVALLHLAPRPGDIEHNKRMVEAAVRRASAMGARFVVSPELVVSGYGFRDIIGTDWIARDQAALARLGGATRPTGIGVPVAGHARGAIGRRCSTAMILFCARWARDRAPSQDQWSSRSVRNRGRRRAIAATVVTRRRHRASRAVRLRRHVFQAPGRRDGRPGDRPSGLVGRLGAGAARSRRRMGEGVARDRAAGAGVQSHRPGRPGLQRRRDRSPPSAATIASSHSSADSAIVLRRLDRRRRGRSRTGA